MRLPPPPSKPFSSWRSSGSFEAPLRETQQRQEEEGGGSVLENAERCRKRPRPSIRSPAGNCLRRRRGIHPEPHTDFCWSMDAQGEGRRWGGQASRAFADVKSSLEIVGLKPGGAEAAGAGLGQSSWWHAH